MRFVAEYVMRGRTQALWVAVLGASTLMFSWVSAAVIALTTLRQGPREGLYILAWAVLPAGFLLAVFNDIGPLAMIVGTAAMAVVLRWTVSWPLSLLASVVVGGLTGAAMLLLAMPYLEQMVAFFAEVIGQLTAQVPEGEESLALQPPGVATIAGMLGLMNAVTCVLSLLLARYWQSLLYNPGGFRQEFHSIRMPAQLSVLMLAGLVLVSLYGLEYRPWAVLFAVPLTVAGLGFIHARTAYRGLGAGWLSIFYLLWLILDPIKMIVIGVAVADSFLDFRGRWPQRPDPDDTN